MKTMEQASQRLVEFVAVLRASQREADNIRQDFAALRQTVGDKELAAAIAGDVIMREVVLYIDKTIALAECAIDTKKEAAE